MPKRLLVLSLLLLAACGEPVGLRSTARETPVSDQGVTTGTASPTPSFADEAETGRADENSDRRDDGSSPPPSASADDHLNGVVRGRVTNGWGEPIAGICIDVWHSNDWKMYMEYAADKTDSDGRYEARFFAYAESRDGPFSVRFRDCRADPSYAFEWYDNVKDMHAAKKLDADEPQVADATLSPDAELAGRVVDDDGRPIKGICVSLYDGSFDDSDEDGAYYRTYAQTSTSSDGTYGFEGLAAMEYRIEFDATTGYDSEKRRGCPGSENLQSLFADEWYNDHAVDGKSYYYPDWPPSDPVTLSTGEDRAGIDAVLERKSSG